jgi:hypothetical protein
VAVVAKFGDRGLVRVEKDVIGDLTSAESARGQDRPCKSYPSPGRRGRG